MTPKSLTFDACVILISPPFSGEPLKSHFNCGDFFYKKNCITYNSTKENK